MTKEQDSFRWTIDEMVEVYGQYDANGPSPVKSTKTYSSDKEAFQDGLEELKKFAKTNRGKNGYYALRLFDKNNRECEPWYGPMEFFAESFDGRVSDCVSNYNEIQRFARELDKPSWLRRKW